MRTNSELNGLAGVQFGWVLAIAEDSEFYIPNALHPERDDSTMLLADDAEACLEAEKEGVALIYNMEGVPNGVYVDTEENRNIISEMLEINPRYRKVALEYNSQ